MKRMFRHMEKGFTLIELMMVVAIIGLLAAVAIPTFLSYQVRSRQTEAKMNLGSLGTSAETYHAECDTYKPTAGEYSDFTTGGSPAITPAVNPLGWAVSGAARYSYFYDGRLYYRATLGAESLAVSPDPGSTADATSFNAYASGDVSKNVADSDQWSFNQARNLLNTLRGL